MCWAWNTTDSFTGDETKPVPPELLVLMMVIGDVPANPRKHWELELLPDVLQTVPEYWNCVPAL